LNPGDLGGGSGHEAEKNETGVQGGGSLAQEIKQKCAEMFHCSARLITSLGIAIGIVLEVAGQNGCQISFPE
jgi:hypothetical protein